CQQGNSNPPTF
nr:immunoglobulin light chain junction region [Macaca mulatta]MOV37247.1 immunoglobulin light chain junction region [Macaca mulatta]MOV37271.1 immunoglobulin light chain junction region [Macaca mulatta]MOV80889.1 immunoglobulin light chain junction region [Macaca mulatta]MOW08100.1 immunoglobulin light chain junction region [Macaca mulatta]